MVRRKPYTKVSKSNQVRAKHVKGMGDVVFKSFQCLNSECREFLFIRKDDIGENFSITCPACGYVLESGAVTDFYSYDLINSRSNTVIQKGQLSILHDDYLDEAQEYKYCIICNTLKPLYMFDKHKARKSKRQGECRLCKTIYNSIKNQTRIIDQHREAAQKRKLYVELSGQAKIDSSKVLKRFSYKCFKCGKDLSDVESEKERPLDHTLAIYYLWSMTTENATLLCRDCNGEKAGRWPSEYYSTDDLKRLAVLTGIDFDLLSGNPKYNPEAIERLKESQLVDQLLVKFGAYKSEVIKLRNRLLQDTRFDFFQYATAISQTWVKEADGELKSISAET